MSRPRFLADQDLNDHIVRGVLHREPTVEFVRVRDLGMEEWSDDEILRYADREQFVVVSHDANTMSAAAMARILAGVTCAGLLIFNRRYWLDR